MSEMVDDDELEKAMPLRFKKRQMRAVDDWRRVQPDIPTKAEAIRRLLDIGLEASDKRSLERERQSDD